MGAAEKLDLVESAAPEWLVRPYDADSDSDALHYLLGVSYSRSRAGSRAGASRAGRRERQGEELPDHDVIAKQKAFLAALSPVWSWLLEHAEVSLAVDPEQPHIIWAWCVTSQPNVVHAVGCKRSLIESGLGADIVGALLGDRLDHHQVCSLELPQLRTKGGDAIGLDRPREWSMDPVWLLMRMPR